MKEKNCGACGQYFGKDEADEKGFHSAKFCDAVEYPTYEEVMKALEETAPENWLVNDDYHFLGVNHPSLTNDQYIAFGDVNGYFGFNDINGDVCGHMEGITEPTKIAESFWKQLQAFYPELIKENN